MDWQQFLSLLIVALAVAGLLWRRFRPRQFEFPRETHCGCATPTNQTAPSITFKARKGERPQIIVRSQQQRLHLKDG